MKYIQENRFFQPWFLFTFLPLIILTSFYYYHKSGVEMFSATEFWIVLTIEILPLIFLLSMKLKIMINPKEIRYRYFPIHWSDKVISFNDILDWHLVCFDPLRDFSGYGYRITKKYGTALITDSHTGLFIHTINGKRITLEIRNTEEFRKAAKENNFPLDADNIIPIRELMPKLSAQKVEN